MTSYSNDTVQKPTFPLSYVLLIMYLLSLSPGQLFWITGQTIQKTGRRNLLARRDFIAVGQSIPAPRRLVGYPIRRPPARVRGRCVEPAALRLSPSYHLRRPTYAPP